MKSSKRKTIAIASVGVVAIVGLIVGFLVFSGVFKPKTTADVIKESVVGQEIINLTSINGEPAATVIIAPPTEDWWWVLGTYTPNPVAYGLDFKKYSTDSKYVAYTLSPGGDFTSYGYLGLPTNFIVYNNEESAQTVSNQLIDDKIPHQLIGDIIFFVPEGAYSDVNYALNQYNNVTTETELDLNGQAMMFMEYKSLKSFLFRAMEEDLDKEGFDMFMGMLGITEESSWSGSSTDGLSWAGKFENVDVDALNNPSDIQNYIQSRTYILDEATNEWVLPPSNLEGGQEVGGVLDAGQTEIFARDFINIRSNTDVASSKDENGIPTVDLLSEDEGYYQININDVNSWLSTMIGTAASFGYTTFETVSITIQKDGSSTVDITFLDTVTG